MKPLKPNDAAAKAVRSERWAVRLILLARASKCGKAGFKRTAAVLRELAEQVWERESSSNSSGCV